MRKPLSRPSNNFVAVPNEYFNGWLKEVSPSETVLLNFILRKTIGFRKQEDWISISQFIKGTGLSKGTIISGLKNLVKKEMIFKRVEGNPGEEKIYYKLNIEQIDQPQSFDLLMLPVQNLDPSPVQNLHGTSAKIEPTIDNITKEKIINPDDLELAELLRTEIKINDPGATITDANVRQWADVVRLMVERNKRSRDEIRALLLWACRHQFWKGNILSMGTLREKFTCLTIQKKIEAKGHNSLQKREGSLNYVAKKQPIKEV